MVTLAVTSMVAISFALPLGWLVHRVAERDTQILAEQRASTIVPLLTITAKRRSIALAIASSPGPGEVAVHLSDGRPIGASRSRSSDLARARRSQEAFHTATEAGSIYLQPVMLGGRYTAVIEVFVPATDQNRMVRTAWLVLLIITVLLILGSLLVSDRLGARVVAAAAQLARAARSIGAGDLSARATPSGPPELVQAANAFNAMADRLVQLRNAERELVADLSHRLRTPLMRLMLDADATSADLRVRRDIALLERELNSIIRTVREPLDHLGSIGCDAAEVVRGRAEFWSVAAEDQDRTWWFRGAAAAAPVSMSRAHLVAALDAVLGNVFRHTAEGTAYAIHLQHTKTYAAITVEDAGPGITNPDFATRRGASSAGSTGLGLDIAARAAKSAGGALTIHRSVLGGTAVQLHLPLHQPHQASK